MCDKISQKPDVLVSNPLPSSVQICCIVCGFKTGQEAQDCSDGNKVEVQDCNDTKKDEAQDCSVTKNDEVRDCNAAKKDHSWADDHVCSSDSHRCSI